MSAGTFAPSFVSRILADSDAIGSYDFSLSRLGTVADQWRSEAEKVVLCHGCFDILHFGHLLHLAEAREFGTKLAVTITADSFVNKGVGRPAFSQEQRGLMLLSLRIVDAVGIVDGATAEPAIAAVRPNIYAKGIDYRDQSSDVRLRAEIELVRQFGGREYFTSTEKYSSASLLKWVVR